LHPLSQSNGSESGACSCIGTNPAVCAAARSRDHFMTDA
jgi:hypothetical protein